MLHWIARSSGQRQANVVEYAGNPCPDESILTTFTTRLPYLYCKHDLISNFNHTLSPAAKLRTRIVPTLVTLGSRPDWKSAEAQTQVMRLGDGYRGIAVDKVLILRVLEIDSRD